MDSKTATNDDVYEFKSVKVEVLKMALTIIATLPQFQDTDSSSEKNTEGGDTEIDATDPLSVPATSTTEETTNKRSHSEFETNEDSEKEEENKKKKRKEDSVKESGKTTLRGT